MKKAIYLILMLVLSISPVYAYDTTTYRIDIPNNFKKSENNDYWQSEDEKVSANILIYTEDNTNNLDISSFEKADLDKNKYVKELEKNFGSLDETINLSDYSVTLDKISSYKAIKIDLKSSYKISDEKDSIVYQRQYITSSKNFIYYVTVSSSNEDSLDSEEIKNVLNSFKIKDELIERQQEYLKYYICLGGIVILILSIKTTKTENNITSNEVKDKKTRKTTKKQK